MLRKNYLKNHLTCPMQQKEPHSFFIILKTIKSFFTYFLIVVLVEKDKDMVAQTNLKKLVRGRSLLFRNYEGFFGVSNY